ncbi:DnaJ domain, zinc finger, CCHC-type, tetratricopeptide-like helical domain protein [Tanacetum coccineum]
MEQIAMVKLKAVEATPENFKEFGQVIEAHQTPKHSDLMMLSSISPKALPEIKKAYHKAALKHHPDKAGTFLARSESGADGHVLKEIFTTIHKDADKLFRKIGEACGVLSDANKVCSLSFLLLFGHIYGMASLSKQPLFILK